MVSSMAQHPLDPLSAAEIKAAAACVRAFRQTPETVRFNSISLQASGSRSRLQWTCTRCATCCRSGDRLSAWHSASMYSMTFKNRPQHCSCSCCHPLFCHLRSMPLACAWRCHFKIEQHASCMTTKLLLRIHTHRCRQWSWKAKLNCASRMCRSQPASPISFILIGANKGRLAGLQGRWPAADAVCGSGAASAAHRLCR